MKRHVEPTPRGFVTNAWYEQVAQIMRSDPQRFFLFSPTTKYCLSVYLEMRERHAREMKLAA
jgi:hypothetical protein